MSRMFMLVFLLPVLVLAPDSATSQQPDTPTGAEVAIAAEVASVSFGGDSWQRVGGARVLAPRLLAPIGEIDGVSVYVQGDLTGPMSLVEWIYLPAGGSRYYAFRRAPNGGGGGA
jgi:hypothetical protein